MAQNTRRYLDRAAPDLSLVTSWLPAFGLWMLFVAALLSVTILLAPSVSLVGIGLLAVSLSYRRVRDRCLPSLDRLDRVSPTSTPLECTPERAALLRFLYAQQKEETRGPR